MKKKQKNELQKCFSSHLISYRIIFIDDQLRQSLSGNIFVRFTSMAYLIR